MDFGYEFWRQNNTFSYGLVGGGGLTTIFAIFIIFIFHFFFFHFFNSSFFRRSLTSSQSPSPLPSSPPSPSSPTTSGVSEIVSVDDIKSLITNLNDDNENWENIIDKTSPLLHYNAKCCKPQNGGPFKYLSITVFENVSPEFLRDFYMDNEYRKRWDKTIIEHHQLQVDETNGIEIGRTIKKFPLLTPREYVLAWRLWEGKDNSFYCVVKECEHPSAPIQRRYVRVGSYRSVPGRNACEIKMFHQEDAGLNMDMAKLAFAKGVWSYVCKMDNALRKYSPAPVQTGSSAVTLIQMIPSELDAVTNSIESTTTIPAENAVYVSGGQTCEKRNFLTKTSKKVLLANGLLLLGGVICLSRGHSSLGAKVAVAYVVSKVSNRGASSSNKVGKT
ncbi:hypothetical protein ACFE04_020826 [Oxalis oulophora]